MCLQSSLSRNVQRMPALFLCIAVLVGPSCTSGGGSGEIDTSAPPPELNLPEDGARDENIAAGRKAMERVKLGMKQTTACWLLGTTCENSEPAYKYVKIIGNGPDQVILRLHFVQGKLKRVELFQLKYDENKDAVETIIEEQGASREEVR